MSSAVVILSTSASSLMSQGGNSCSSMSLAFRFGFLASNRRLSRSILVNISNSSSVRASIWFRVSSSGASSSSYYHHYHNFKDQLDRFEQKILEQTDILTRIDSYSSHLVVDIIIRSKEHFPF